MSKSIWGAILALGLMESKDLEGALREGELACQRDHRSHVPRVVVAGIRLLRHEPELARQAMKDAYRIKPDLAPAQVFALLGRDLGGNLLKLR